ncbi:MAG: glycosyltransferase family 2 protein [Metallibacterium sp.]
MASDTPRVSVLMVLADSGDGALDAARRVLAAPECAELVVLDNASRDGIAQRLAREYADVARVRVLELGANLGFGAAMNRGAAVARGDWLLLLNPDCLLAADSVSRLLDAAQGGALAGAIVCDAQGRPDPAAWRRAPTLRRVLCMMSGLARHESRWPALAGVNRRDALPDATVAVEALSGALMLLPRAVFARVGGFDEGYFLHFEDLDLCTRARATGTPLRLAGAVRVLHAKGGSSGGRALFVARHKHRGLLRYLRTHDAAARRWPWRALLPALVWLHFALQAPRLTLRDARTRRARSVRPPAP